MAKEERFEKVVEWDEHLSDCIYTDKDYLIDGIWFMIPILGQIYWLGALFFSLYNRRVFWRKVK